MRNVAHSQSLHKHAKSKDMTMMAKCKAKATPIIVVFATPPAAKTSVRTTVVPGENDARLSRVLKLFRTSRSARHQTSPT